MFQLAVKENLDKKFKKLGKKDRELLRELNRKIEEIISDPFRFKPLHNKRRVHIGGSFVLIYEVDKDAGLITLFDFDHHDNIYKV